MEVSFSGQRMDLPQVNTCIRNARALLTSQARIAGGRFQPLQHDFVHPEQRCVFAAAEAFPHSAYRLLYTDVFNTLFGIDTKMEEMGYRELIIGILRALPEPHGPVYLGKATIGKSYIPLEINSTFYLHEERSQA